MGIRSLRQGVGTGSLIREGVSLVLLTKVLVRGDLFL